MESHSSPSTSAPFDAPQLGMEYVLTPEAIELGLDAALPAMFDIGKERGFGQGERASPSVTQQSLRFLMINRRPRESLPATVRSA